MSCAVTWTHHGPATPRPNRMMQAHRRSLWVVADRSRCRRCILSATRGDSMQRCIGRDWSVVERATIAIVTVFGMAWAVSTPVDLAARSPHAVPTQSKPATPAFQVDPLWPKPLPNGWILGSVTGIAVDSQDHIWIVHRGAASLNA